MSKDSFNKREREKKKQKKKQDKEEKKEERKAYKKEHGAGDMIAYVDEYGQLSSTPTDPSRKAIIDIDNIQISISKKEDEPADKVGRVTYFNTDKGYGFIKEDDTQQSYFVHTSDISGSVKENDKVSFELAKGPKGMSAVLVKKI